LAYEVFGVLKAEKLLVAQGCHAGCRGERPCQGSGAATGIAGEGFQGKALGEARINGVLGAVDDVGKVGAVTQRSMTPSCGWFPLRRM